MKSNKTTLFAVEGVVIMVVAIAAILIGVWLFSRGGTVDTASAKIKFDQYVATAKVFRSRNDTYQGVCGDIALPAGVRCTDTSTAFKIERMLDTGGAYCADSTGFSGPLAAPSNPQSLTCL